MHRPALLLLLACLLSGGSSVLAQPTAHDSVLQVVEDYITGTSYNRPDLLERAFHPDISMYFADRAGELWEPAREEYIGGFRKGEPGTPTGRQGNVRYVEVAGDVATAKAEILILETQRLYIDYFLLRRNAGLWQIMSKTASNAPSNQRGGRILMVVSNATHYGESDIPSSNHFGEITAAYDVFAKAGFTVDFVSPTGGPVQIDYFGRGDKSTWRYVGDRELFYRLEHTHTPQALRAADYGAVYYPGGAANMFGVPQDTGIHRLVRGVYEEQRGVVAAVCHGTYGLGLVDGSDGEGLVNGRKITGFPHASESPDRPYYKTLPFVLEDAIAAQGGTFAGDAPVDSGYFVVDGRFVTGMDYTSTASVATAVVQLLAGGDDE